MARTSTKSRSRKTTARKRPSTRAKAGSRVKAKASSRTKAKATRRPKAKAASRTKAKATRRPKAKAASRTKAKATRRPKAKASSRTKAKATRRPKAKATRRPKARATRSTKPVAQKKQSSTKDFDLNKWLLPTLEIEKYEPSILPDDIGVQDRIDGRSTRYAWLGAGQCGGRLVKSFYDLGYRKALAINTTHHDLDLLGIPEKQKFLMDIGEKGAGKDMERGNQAVQQYHQDILHLARQTFGTQVDRIMVCFGAGGGTGSGSATGLVEIAKRYARYIGLKKPNKKVGVIMTLPTVGEAGSPLVAQNAYDVAIELGQMAAAGEISPLIIVDNDKISRRYPEMTVKSFWPTINSSVASLFDIFNRLSSFSSQYIAFDPVDYQSIMESGGCMIMGLTKVKKLDSKYAISVAVKTNLEKTLLADGFDLSTASVAGCAAVGGKRLIANERGLQDNLNYAFDVLGEITGKATIHRGIYEDDRDCLRVYTIIGGMDLCTSRLEELVGTVSTPVEVG